ncbi:hypothetical protein FIU28_16810 [Tardiphaga sp. vice154]|uniref:hypothetical protein n=1 Tax=Tardiphaga sp. vice154 TaxID=2592814 RepID=UPI001162CF33|nr:hypothetical protein [Tardiphaga sp. vice154]QDM22628.1 hypothetical protein FIU28_16810 [Tardiphaga sp. vice154]
MSVIVKANRDTFLLALPIDLSELSDQEKVSVSAGCRLAVSAISEIDGCFKVELIDHMIGNWRKTWFGKKDHWDSNDDEPNSDIEFVKKNADQTQAVVGPKTIDLSSEKPNGHIDSYSQTSILGWAYYPAHPDLRANVHFFFDGAMKGYAVANRFRPDVQKAGHGDGSCGFDFVPPEGEFDEATTIEVRTSNGQTIGVFNKLDRT